MLRCAYTEPNGGWSSYIGDLESRILALETALNAKASVVQPLNCPTKRSRDGDGDGRNRRSSSSDAQPEKRARIYGPDTPEVDSHTGETLVNLKQGQIEDESSVQDTVLDGMGALKLGDDEEDYGYFGPSSNIAFIGHIAHALGTPTTLSKEIRYAESHEFPLPSIEFPHKSSAYSTGEFGICTEDVNIFALPPQKRIIYYIELYFQNTNMLFPYLHKPSFLATYNEALRDSFSRVRRTWLALLNLVMAMGSRASTEAGITAEEKYTAAEIFYRRGFGLCDGHILRLSSLDSVQLLLLMSHYLQSTRKPNQCWTTHGLAVRIALQLGLHSNQTLERFKPLERELRKRAWYGCVLLDRTLCMTFGRPSTVTTYAEKLDLPLDVEDGAFTSNKIVIPTQPSQPTSVTFFILSIKLYTLLGSIIDTLYGGNLGGGDQVEPTSADVACVAGIEEKLSAWRRDIPPRLSIVTLADIPDGGGSPRDFWRQRIILSLRYYNTRALLHRQFVVQGLNEIRGADPSTNNRFEGDFFRNLGWASINLCAESAIESVKIVYKVKDRSDWLGFWWFTLYYTFNASLVLVSKILIASRVRRLAHRPDSTPETMGLLGYIQMATDTIEVLAAGNRIANRCCLYLKHLMRYVAPLATPPNSQLLTIAAQPTSLLERAVADPDTSALQKDVEHDPYQVPPDEMHQSPFRSEISDFIHESDLILASINMSGMPGIDHASSQYLSNGNWANI